MFVKNLHNFHKFLEHIFSLYFNIVSKFRFFQMVEEISSLYSVKFTQSALRKTPEALNYHSHVVCLVQTHSFNEIHGSVSHITYLLNHRKFTTHLYSSQCLVLPSCVLLE